MAYPKQTWDTSSYVNPTRMNHIEDGIKSAVDGLTNIYIEGSTNNTGSTITKGKYFYLNGTLVRAKTDIASGATFTLNTNYEVVTIGDALDGLIKFKTVGGTTGSTGVLSLGLSYPENTVLYCVVPNEGYAAIAKVYSTNWQVLVMNNSASNITPVVSQTVSVKVAYI